MPMPRFYATSPRSPALHFAIAKQLTVFNLLHLLSSIVLCIDITTFGFNYSLSPATRGLLVAANLTGVPALFLALTTLFQFYSRLDPWASQGVHLVFLQDLPTVLGPAARGDAEGWADATATTLLHPGDATVEEGSEPEATAEVVEDEAPQAESTTLGAEEEEEEAPLNTEQDETTEADRNHDLPKKARKKVTLLRTSAMLQSRMRRSCCTLVTDVASVDVSRGRWVDVSD